MIANTCNPSSPEAEAGGNLKLEPSMSDLVTQGDPVLNKKIKEFGDVAQCTGRPWVQSLVQK